MHYSITISISIYQQLTRFWYIYLVLSNLITLVLAQSGKKIATLPKNRQSIFTTFKQNNMQQLQQTTDYQPHNDVYVNSLPTYIRWRKTYLKSGTRLMINKKRDQPVCHGLALYYLSTHTKVSLYWLCYGLQCCVVAVTFGIHHYCNGYI